MKKALRILPLAAVALLAVLAFTGCDKILEVFYPEFGPDDDGGGGGAKSYTVVFEVKLPTATLPDYWKYKLVVKLEGPDGVVTRTDFARPPATTGGEATYTARFENLPEGSYHAYAWQDSVTQNQQPDPGEPYGVATENGNQKEYFWLPEADTSTYTYTVPLYVPDTSGQNTVKAKVWIPKSIPDWNAANRLKVTIQKQSGDQIYQPTRNGTAADSTDPLKGFKEFIYDGVPGGDYRAFAWLDLNGDNFPQDNEPFGVPTGGREYFNLPSSGSPTTIDLDIQIYPIQVITTPNTLNVNVWIDQNIPESSWSDVVRLEVARQDGPPIPDPVRRATAGYDPMYPTMRKAAYTYSNLPDGQYRVSTWIDVNYNWIWDPGEVGAVLNPGYGENFWLSAGANVTYDMWLWAPPPADVPKVVVQGPQVLAVGDAASRNYQIVVLGGTQSVSSFQWAIMGYYSVVQGTGSGNSASIWFDPMNFYAGTYTLEISNVQLSSGSYTNNTSMDVKFITEVPQGTDYYYYLYGYNFDYEPFYLDTWSSYNVKIEVLDFWWSKPWWQNPSTAPGEITFWGTLYNGYFSISTNGNWVGPNGTGIFDYNTLMNGVDRYRVYIDTDWDGWFYGDNDLATEFEAGVSDTDYYDTWAYAYNPTVYLPSSKFLKYKDFVTVYPGSPYRPY